MEREVSIIKSTGEKAAFSEKKLKRSLQNSGASIEQIDFILSEVKSKLFPEMTTKSIYKLAYTLLRNGSRHIAARYQLKKAIMELGPSGYAFEKYVAEILKYQGYKTEVSQFIKGKCVTHEVDVIAEKENLYCLIECKYHSDRSKSSDVKVPLYIKSRFEDIKVELLKIPSHALKKHQGWVVTNTQFSLDAIQFGNCSGLNMISWSYPEKGSLKNLIDSLGLYPVTCLTSLTKSEKQFLLDKKIVLCKEISNSEKVLQEIISNPNRIYTILKEAEQLCENIKIYTDEK